MADDLVDFRGRISMRSSCAIEARATATGRERQEIVREILDAWTAQQVHEAMLLHRALLSEGLQGIVSGVSGIPREPGGSK